MRITATMGALFMFWLLAASITTLRAAGARSTLAPDADAGRGDAAPADREAHTA